MVIVFLNLFIIQKHKQIGIVCVGLTEKNIHKLIFRSLMPILFWFIIRDYCLVLY